MENTIKLNSCYDVYNAVACTFSEPHESVPVVPLLRKIRHEMREVEGYNEGRRPFGVAPELRIEADDIYGITRITAKDAAGDEVTALCLEESSKGWKVSDLYLNSITYNPALELLASLGILTTGQAKWLRKADPI